MAEVVSTGVSHMCDNSTVSVKCTKINHLSHTYVVIDCFSSSVEQVTLFFAMATFCDRFGSRRLSVAGLLIVGSDLGPWVNCFASVCVFSLNTSSNSVKSISFKTRSSSSRSKTVPDI